MTSKQAKPADGLYTTVAVGERLGYSEASVRRMCEAGLFDGAYRAGRGAHWRIPESALDLFLRAGRPKKRSPR